MLNIFENFSVEITLVLGLVTMWRGNVGVGIKKKNKTIRYSDSAFGFEGYVTGT